MKFFVVLFFIILVSCGSDSTDRVAFEKEYLGFWADTAWSYRFQKDGTFVFNHKGHYGNSVESGIYTVIGDLILLIPDTDWAVFDGVLKTKLKRINDSCLRDFEGNYYCVSQELAHEKYEQEIIFHNKAKDILSSLSLVKDLKSDIADQEGLKNFEPFFSYDGIIVNERNEFHSFVLESFDRSERTMHAMFLVKKNPFEIYRYQLSGDSLTLIYK